MSAAAGSASAKFNIFVFEPILRLKLTKQVTKNIKNLLMTFFLLGQKWLSLLLRHRVFWECPLFRHYFYYNFIVRGKHYNRLAPSLL
jgi:hypothetical protein